MKTAGSISFVFLALSSPVSAPWTPQISGTTNTLNSIHCIDANNGWIVGSNGTILKTNNGGESWRRQQRNTNDDLRDLYFIDENIGWIVGFGSASIMKTVDGGNNWIIQSTSGAFYGVCFTA
jgi:photosystem II stability/assembly factor-like uncharacterized protein